jgi:hypothetical protein
MIHLDPGRPFISPSTAFSAGMLSARSVDESVSK